LSQQPTIGRSFVPRQSLRFKKFPVSRLNLKDWYGRTILIEALRAPSHVNVQGAV